MLKQGAILPHLDEYAWTMRISLTRSSRIDGITSRKSPILKGHTFHGSLGIPSRELTYPRS